MILNIMLLYDKVGCLLDILGQEKCFQCLQREKSAQSLNRASAQRSLLGRERKDEHTTFPLYPGWTCSVSVGQRCLYQARALRALGLLLADGTPTVGGGKTF